MSGTLRESLLDLRIVSSGMCAATIQRTHWQRVRYLSHVWQRLTSVDNTRVTRFAFPSWQQWLLERVTIIRPLPTLFAIFVSVFFHLFHFPFISFLLLYFPFCISVLSYFIFVVSISIWFLTCSRFIFFFVFTSFFVNFLTLYSVCYFARSAFISCSFILFFLILSLCFFLS